MSNIVVKIMGEVIVVLALATKQIKQGRLSKWTFTYSSESFPSRTYYRENFQEATWRERR